MSRDNLSVPMSARAKGLIATASWRLVFLSTFSRDFNPIQQAFAKTTQTLRRIDTRTWEAVGVAVRDARITITADARAFFAAAGFLVHSR